MAPKGQKVVTVHRLMAVLDQPEAAVLAKQALVREGFAADAITVLQGDRDADRMDSFGKSSGPLRKLWRVVQFTQADQMVDLVVYEAALRDGRVVLTVRARRTEDRGGRSAVDRAQHPPGLRLDQGHLVQAGAVRTAPGHRGSDPGDGLHVRASVEPDLARDSAHPRPLPITCPARVRVDDATTPLRNPRDVSNM